MVALHQSQLRVKETPTVKLGLISLHPSAPLQSAGGVQRPRVCHALPYRDTLQRLPSSSLVRLLIWTITVNPCSNKQWRKLTHKKLPFHMNGPLPKPVRVLSLLGRKSPLNLVGNWLKEAKRT